MSAIQRYGRGGLAAAAALLVHLVASNGLFFPDYAAAAQVALLAGIVAGALAPDALEAAVAAGLGLLCGIALQPAGVWPDLATIAITIGVGAIVAALVRSAIASAAVRPSLVLGLALVLVAANLWLTAATVAPLRRQGGTQSSAFEVIAHRPAPGERLGDSGFYRDVVWKMRDGSPYYQAYHDAWFVTWDSAPSSIFSVRQPTIFRFWAALPGWPRSAFYAFLLFATAAVAAATFVSARAVPAALTVFGAAAVAAYLLRFALEPGLLFLQEEWVGALAVVVFAVYAFSQDERRHRPLMATAAGLALLAMMLRELMLFVVLAGLAAAFFSDRRHRRFDLSVWAGALLAGFAYWGVHALRTNTVFSDRVPDPTAWVGNAGVSNLLHGLTDSTVLLNAHAWVPVVLAVLGVAGALAQPDRQYRVFASAAVLMPLAGFLFLGNGAADLGGMTASNYWGAIVMPALLALAPSSFALLPAVASWRTPSSAEDGGRETASDPEPLAEAR